MSTHIPPDIEIEIMKRLPMKSLIRFMSACKAWKSMISCSRFVSSYGVLPANHLLLEFHKGRTLNNEVNYVCFADDDTFPQQKLDLPLPPLLQLFNHAPRIIGTSCGLFCFYGLLRKPDNYNNQSGMCVLWNPLIRKSVVVPVPNHSDNYEIGFGVSPSTKDPKLVRFIYVHPYWEVTVFTLSSGEWRFLCSNQRPLIKSISYIMEHIVIGQFIYWHAVDRANGLCNMIISFDLSTDEFKEVVLPDSLRESHFLISKIRDSLVLLDYDLISTKGCDVWMMGHGDRKTFTKLFTIKAPDVKWIVGFRKTGEPIIQRRDGLPCALLVYEPCSEYIKDFGICGTGRLQSMHSYMESLLLLDH